MADSAEEDSAEDTVDMVVSDTEAMVHAEALVTVDIVVLGLELVLHTSDQLAMCSMIIPGVSGSFVLILMGNYNLIMVESLTKLGDGQFKEAFTILIPVGIGAVVGMAALSRLLSWLFKRFHHVAVATITGFVAGSLVTIWPWKTPILSLIHI